MKQQVNLLTAQFPMPLTLDIPPRWNVLIILIATLIAAGAGYGLWSIEVLKRQLDVDLATRDFTEQAVNRLKSAVKKTDGNQSQLELVDLKKQAEQKQALLSRLQREGQLAAGGFSEHFFALARQDIEGVWLQSIQIEEYGDRLTFKGQTSDPKQVSVFFQNLGKEQVYRGVSFVEFSLNKSEKDSGSVNGFTRFVVSTHALPDVLPTSLARRTRP